MEDANEQQPPVNPPPQAENNNRNPSPQGPAPKCPRCDSLNTKFCYFNNLSPSQPRYFCRACRRHWTHGGTLRNIPFGGRTRRESKRSRASPSSSPSSSSSFSIGESSRAQSQPLPALPPPNSGFTGGGEIFSSLAAIQSLNRSPPGFNQVPLNPNGQFSSEVSSYMAFLQGLTATPTFRTTQAQQMQHQSDHHQLFEFNDQNLVDHRNRPLGSWTQRFINNPSTSSNPSASNSTTNNNVSWTDESFDFPQSNNISVPPPPPPSLDSPNQWPDDLLPVYGPPPPA